MPEPDLRPKPSGSDGRGVLSAGPPMKAIVSVKNATKDYALGKTVVQALRGVSLDVHEGSFLSIAGPSGSGKTTLLNLIGCVDVPPAAPSRWRATDTRAAVRTGADPAAPAHHRLHLPELHLVSVLNVLQNVELPLAAPAGGRARSARRGCWPLLERVGLPRATPSHRPSELSGGKRQRVAIARRAGRPGRSSVLPTSPPPTWTRSPGRSIIDADEGAKPHRAAPPSSSPPTTPGSWPTPARWCAWPTAGWPTASARRTRGAGGGPPIHHRPGGVT
jgi:putative ABC transport system ATP-binding protein